MKRFIIIMASTCMIFGLIYYLWAQEYEKDYSYIYKVQINEDNYLYINVTDQERGNNFDPRHGCGSQTYARSQWPLSDDRTKGMLQVALASALNKSPVHIWTRGCETNKPVFYRLQLYALP